MLVAALVYHYVDIQCADGLYSLEGKYCVTAEQCKQYRNYNYLYRSVDVCIYCTHHWLSAMQCVDRIYECIGEHYFKFYYEDKYFTVACAYINNIRAHSLYQVNGKNVYADDYFC